MILNTLFQHFKMILAMMNSVCRSKHSLFYTFSELFSINYPINRQKINWFFFALQHFQKIERISNIFIIVIAFIKTSSAIHLRPIASLHFNRVNIKESVKAQFSLHSRNLKFRISLCKKHIFKFFNR